jgi:hypothetical protein
LETVFAAVFLGAIRDFFTGGFAVADLAEAFFTGGFTGFFFATISETFRLFGASVFAFKVFDFTVLPALSLLFETLELREEFETVLFFCVLPSEAFTLFLTAFFISDIVL